jgi:hypothetical protein
VTTPELPLNSRGQPVSERLCTSPITAQFGARIEHEVTDDAFAASQGEYEATCGCVFLPAPLTTPPGRPCQACLDILTAAHQTTAHRSIRHRVRLRQRLMPMRRPHRAPTRKDTTR